MLASADPFFLSAAVGIGGSAVALVNTFGTPLIVRQGADEAAFIFPNGLVAHVGSMHAQGGIVTYLAVQALGARSVPKIGHFTDEAERAREVAPPRGDLILLSDPVARKQCASYSRPSTHVTIQKSA